MKSINPTVVCRPMINHKREYKLDCGIVLEIQNQFQGNMRERNPQLAEVVAVPDGPIKGYWEDEYDMELMVGDTVLCQHFQFADKSGNRNKHNVFSHDGEDLYGVDYKEVYFALRGDDLIMLGDYVLLDPVRQDDLKSDSIYLPDTVTTIMSKKKAKVVAVSKYFRENAPEINIGDIVYALDDHCLYEITLDKKKYYRSRLEEIVAVEKAAA